MLDLGVISFASPWLLGAAIALPLVWLLLRITPPAIKQIAFPAVALMFGLKPTERTPARTPWWLVALRMAILALALTGLARPLLNAEQGSEGRPLLIVLDNGWAAAVEWQARLDTAQGLINAADRRGRDVALAMTAPVLAGEAEAQLEFLSAREALERLRQAAPRPWASDHAALDKTLAAMKFAGRIETVWISDGIETTGRAALIARLRNLGTVAAIEASAARPPLVLLPPQRTVGDGGVNRIEFRLVRVLDGGAPAPAIAATVRLSDTAGNVLARATLEFAANQTAATAGLSLPAELVNRVARFDVDGEPGAGATVLADDRWQRRPVGIVTGGTQGASAPLLDDAHYIAQALGPSADIRTGRIDGLLQRPLSLIFVSSDTELSTAEADAAETWIDKGGVLVRFAGSRFDGNEPFLPVKLRAGGRSIGGALSWGDPPGLGAFPDRSPFRGLAVPDDIKIKTQVLAEPSPELPDRTWAKLADGTPLVTAAQRGSGWIVLFHVSATPDWSNLPLSGLFVDMLRRLTDVSRGVGSDESGAAPTSLAPVAMLDGLGRLVPPGPMVNAIPFASMAAAAPGPATPPGVYGTAESRYALNLTPSLIDTHAAAAWPAGVGERTLNEIERERDLKPWLLFAALVLLLGDLILSFGLRGLLPRPAMPGRNAVAGIVVLAAVSLSFAALAQSDRSPQTIDPEIAAAVLETRLAYVVTGNSEIDRICDAGLAALTRVLSNRTSAEMQQPAAVDLSDPAIDADHLVAYPMVYWRVTGSQAVPSDQALAAVNAYLRGGGMVVFDAPDQVGAIGNDSNTSAGSRLTELVARLDIPPLMELREDHVLNRAFYLTNGLPGRYSAGPVYIERATSANDAVSSVIIGGRDWAAAWARDRSGLPQFPMIPGGETQREYAYRAGVNMVMYALTGNYKADQVHIPAIMQRLTQ